MINAEQINHILSRVTYKPNTVFQMGPNMLNGKLTIHITQPVTNAKFPHDQTTVRKSFALKKEDFELDEEGFLKKLYKELLDMEEHELQEFFKIDGHCLVDPHPETKMRMTSWDDMTKSKNMQDYLRATPPRFLFDEFSSMRESLFRPENKEKKEKVKWMVPFNTKFQPSRTMFTGLGSASHRDSEDEDGDTEA